MSFFGLGRLVYVIILITNSIAILSEDRFLARIGWGRQAADPAFGATYDSTSVKAKTINLIASIRTVMRSTYSISTRLDSQTLSSTFSFRSYVEGGLRWLHGHTKTWKTVPLIVINTIIIVYELILG
ncbi:Yos1-like-domain-containing protein [Aspergillus terricola var. indicus]